MIHRPKKSLAQNFLKSSPALKMMCSVSKLESKDIVLEIGPGKGALTKKLLEKAGKVIAVEKDEELFIYLQEKFAEEIKTEHLVLIEQDILNFDIVDFDKYGLLNEKYKIIANIPYYITGLILKKFLSSKIKPTMMTLLIQKEVAKRIIGIRENHKLNSKISGEESILSLSVKAYGEPTYVMKVEKRFFSPSPKVDSAILNIKNISKKNFSSKKEEELFFIVVKSGFAHKRKILKKNLESLGKKSAEIDKIFEKLKINTKIRAEDVPFRVWLNLVKYF